MIAYFPILTSETTNFELLEKVRIGFEAEYASYLSLAINATSSLGEDSTTKAGDLIKRVHTNELPSKGLNIPYDGVRALLDESVKFDSMTLADDLNLELLEAFGNGQIARTADASLKWPGTGTNGAVTAADIPATGTNANTLTPDEIQREVIKRNRENKDYENREENHRSNMRNAQLNRANQKLAMQANQAKLDSSFNTSKVERRENANQSAPTLITVNATTAAGATVTATYGVKCQIHALKQEEIKKYTAETIKRKSMMFRAIQWYTGELKMWKDIILNSDNNKKMALSSPWWKFLYNNAKINKFKAFIRNQYLMIPNATLLLTDTEVEAIYREYGVDVMKNANVLINELFLARLAVLDEANATINIYDERTKSFQRVTVASIFINKETDNVSELFKNILR